MSNTNRDDSYNNNSPVVRSSLSKVKKALIPGGAVLTAVAIAWNSFFTGDVTQVAYVRHFTGSVDPTQYGTGLHWKLPFLDTVDRLQISQNVLSIPGITVNATNDPGVQVDLTLNVQVPKSDAYYLLYGLGNPGNIDINSTILPVVSSRVIQELSAGPASELTINFAQTQASLTRDVGQILESKYGIELISLNLSNVQLGSQYEASSQAVAQSANAVLQANNQAQQQVIQAQAAANVRIAQATGEAQSTVVAAQANLTAAKLNAEAAALTGQGEANRQKAIIVAFGSVDKYIQYEYAQRWSGNYPTVLSNGTGGANTVVIPSLPQQFGATAPTSVSPTP